MQKKDVLAYDQKSMLDVKIAYNIQVWPWVESSRSVPPADVPDLYEHFPFQPGCIFRLSSLLEDSMEVLPVLIPEAFDVKSEEMIDAYRKLSAMMGGEGHVINNKLENQFYYYQKDKQRYYLSIYW